MPAPRVRCGCINLFRGGKSSLVGFMGNGFNGSETMTISNDPSGKQWQCTRKGFTSSFVYFEVVCLNPMRAVEGEMNVPDSAEVDVTISNNAGSVTENYVPVIYDPA